MTLTKTLKLTDDNDLDFSSGGMELLTGIDSLVQRVKIRLLTFRGECFASPETGTPWLTEVFAGGIPKTSTLNAAIISALDTVEGIKEIKSINYEFEKATRKLFITLEILADNDETAQINVESAV